MTSDLSNFLYFYKIVEIINYPALFEHSIFTFETFYKLINILLHKLDYNFREFYEFTELFSNFNIYFYEEIQSDVYKLIIKTFLSDTKNFYILRIFLLVLKKFDFLAQKHIFNIISYYFRKKLYQTNPKLFNLHYLNIAKCLNFDKDSQYSISKFLYLNLLVEFDMRSISELDHYAFKFAKKLNVSKIFNWINKTNVCTGSECSESINIIRKESRKEAVNMYYFSQLPFHERVDCCVKSLKSLSFNSITNPCLVKSLYQNNYLISFSKI
jgi:hypothetical protein